MRPVNGYDAKGLFHMRKVLGKNLVRGVVLYLGSEVVHLAENIHALPAGYLFIESNSYA